MIKERPRMLIKVTFLKHFALGVRISQYIYKEITGYNFIKLCYEIGTDTLNTMNQMPYHII